MKNQLSRRMFLKGACGASLAIPFLPSLTTRAFAQEETVAIGPRFFFMRTSHGDVWGANMYPSEGMLTDSVDYHGRQVRYGSLPNVPTEGATSVSWSPVCTATADHLTPAVAQKMNILRGIDVPYNIGHQGGINLGNIGASAVGISEGLKQSYATPTIDQKMAYSQNFYSEEELSSRVLRRSFVIGNGISYGYSQASTQSGAIIKTQGFESSNVLFNYLFNGARSLSGWNASLLNRVYDQYRRMLRHPRLASADRVRLEQHMTRMADLERLLSVSGNLEGEMPSGPGTSGDSQAYHRNNQLRFAKMYVDAYIQVIVAAFETGVCRIGSWNIGDTFFTEPAPSGVWHEQVAHGGLGAEMAQAYAVSYNQGAFEHVFSKLAKELDHVVLADGQSALDHSLLVFGQEHGQLTHHTQDCKTYPIITAGLAGGLINGGRFIDFSDQTTLTYNNSNSVQAKPGLQNEYAGLHYNQFLANCLLSMGIPNQEWENSKEVTVDGPSRSASVQGYGALMSGGSAYHSVEQRLSEPLPLFLNA